jgi:hypothetical protein
LQDRYFLFAFGPFLNFLSECAVQLGVSVCLLTCPNNTKP